MREKTIVEILQDYGRKGKECGEEVSWRVTRCYKEGRMRVSVKLGDDKRVHVRVRQGCWELLRTLIKQIKTEYSKTNGARKPAAFSSAMSSI